MYTDHMDKLAFIDEDKLADIFTPAKIVNIANLYNILIPLFLIVSGLVLLGMLFLGAFKVLTAGGNPENLESGKRTMTYSVVGFFIIIFSFVIVKVIAYVFNIELFF